MEFRILYCQPCGYLEQARDLAAELRRRFDANVTVEEGGFGQFDVLQDGVVVASKGGVLRRVFTHGAPSRDEILKAIEDDFALRTGEVPVPRHRGGKMTPEECVMRYAAAFEETYRDDDWSRLAPYFAEDATYEVVGGPLACKIEGRDAVFRGLKKSIDGLDRRCDARRIALTKGPETQGDRVEIDWTVTYDRAGAPSITFPGRTIATVSGDRITALVDEYDDEAMAPVGTWLAKHGPDLDGSYT
jgi:predicted Rdx family selenoprotein